MAEWITGRYDVQQIGFRIDRSNAIQHTESTTLSDTPAHTNQSHQPRLYGWCGTWNDTATYGNGIWKVVRVVESNGRCQIEEVADEAEAASYLERVGFPELLAEWQEKA